MNWDGYTVFSTLTGIACVVFALFVKNGRAKDRVVTALCGVLFFGYGLFVAAQTSGTWSFPVLIFVAPFALIAKLIYDGVTQKKAQAD